MTSENNGPERKKFKPTPLEHRNNSLQNNPYAEAIPKPAPAPQSFFDSDEDDLLEIPNDTIAAISLLKNQFPKLQGVG